MTKPRTFKKHIEIYDIDLHVASGIDWTWIEQRFYDENSNKVTLDDCMYYEAICLNGYNKDGGLCLVMGFKSIKPNICTIVHECYHAIERVRNHFAIEEEASAYLCDYIFGLIYEFYYKRKKAIGKSRSKTPK